jgi:hypothetical protein
MRKELSPLGVRGFPLGTAEKVPPAIHGSNERVIVDVPSFLLSGRWTMDYFESADSQYRIRRSCGGTHRRLWIRHHSPRRSKSSYNGSPRQADTPQCSAASGVEFVFWTFLAIPHHIQPIEFSCGRYGLYLQPTVKSSETLRVRVKRLLCL